MVVRMGVCFKNECHSKPLKSVFMLIESIFYFQDLLSSMPIWTAGNLSWCMICSIQQTLCYCSYIRHEYLAFAFKSWTRKLWWIIHTTPHRRLTVNASCRKLYKCRVKLKCSVFDSITYFVSSTALPILSFIFYLI